MSESVNRYRIYCQTESEFVFVWNTTPPTVCPNNNTHTIDLNSVSILDSVSQNTVYVYNEVGATGGQYRSEGRLITIPANSTESDDYVWTFDINVVSVFFNTSESHFGDVINSLIAPYTTIGVLVQGIYENDTTIYVSPSVLTYCKRGYLITLTDGVNTSELGQALTLNNDSIICENGSSHSFSAGTYVQMSINNIRNFVIGSAGQTKFASRGSTSSPIPANTVVRVKYQNNGNVEKKFVFGFDYFY